MSGHDGHHDWLDYDVVDVFTDVPFAGNQLAVVHGAASLSAEQCLTLAQEFGYSESTFPEPVAAGEYRVRIFTPGGEIPFAGHPTLGTAWVLSARGALGGEEAVQHCGAGAIEVTFGAGDVVGLAAAPRDLAGPLPDDLVADLLRDLGLAEADRDGPAYAAGTGLTFVHLPVAADAVARARVSTTPLSTYAARLGRPGRLQDPVEGVNLVHVGGNAPDLEVRSRVFVPGLSVPEDAATGSAATGLGVALVASAALPDGGSYVITQGVEMGRPSRLHGRVEAAGGSATRVHVAGGVQPVARGTVRVPTA